MWRAVQTAICAATQLRGVQLALFGIFLVAQTPTALANVLSDVSVGDSFTVQLSMNLSATGTQLNNPVANQTYFSAPPIGTITFQDGGITAEFDLFALFVSNQIVSPVLLSWEGWMTLPADVSLAPYVPEIGSMFIVYQPTILSLPINDWIPNLTMAQPASFGISFPSDISGSANVGGSLTGYTSSDTGAVLSGTIDTVQLYTTPIPAALPLFVAGLGTLGLLGWRRKRKPTAQLA